jgi:hypothetical protein
MADPYSGVSITGYNSNPPVDDGSQTEANRVKWSTIKTKITDPVKTRTDSMDTALIAAFAKMIGGAGITSTGISYTVIAGDQGKLVRATASGITITTPDATDVDVPFVFCLLNDSTGDITFDGSGSQTVDGDASVTVPPNSGLTIFTDGTNWFTTGQNFQRTLIQPQGYLTLLSVASSPTTPMPVSNQVAATSVYYRPYRGNLIPIPDGTTFAVREFSELTLTLNDPNHVGSGIYDVFIFSDSGTISIGTGPVWTTVTAGAGARGTGAATTELDLLKGLFVNKVAATMRNGATTYSVGAKSGIYVASIFIDAAAGQITCHVAAGNRRKWGVWNAFNRRPITLKLTDATGTWTSAPTTWRQSRGDTDNFVHVLSGLPEETYDLRFSQIVASAVNISTSVADIGIGYNSTTVLSGRMAEQLLISPGTNTIRTTLTAEHKPVPSIGVNTVNPIEQAPNGTTSNTFLGTESNMLLTASYFG